VIGRLVSAGDQHFAAGSLLCNGDKLYPANGLAIVECFDAKRVVTLTENSVINVASKCGDPPQRLLPCSPKNQKNCLELKGPREADKRINILSPIEGALKDGRPDFSWSAVPSATSYSVDVSGPGANWLKSSLNRTSLQYPSTESPMQNGNAYTVTVVAYRGKTPISAGKGVFNILSEEEIHLLAKEIELVHALNLPKDEAASLDLNTIYLSHNLQDEAVKLLQLRIKEGTKDPAIYGTLGDRYLDANLPDLAKPMYKRAEALAFPENPRELARAKAGLEKISRLY